MMSKCGKCNGFMWEIHEESPSGSAFKVNFVRCAMCKVPIGVLPYFDTHTKLEKIEGHVKASDSSIKHALAVIDENVRRLFHK